MRHSEAVEEVHEELQTDTDTTDVGGVTVSLFRIQEVHLVDKQPL